MNDRYAATFFGLMIVLICLLGATSHIAKLCADPQQPALHLPCKIVEVYDGDTLTADITLRVRVRMLDCWAPEIKEAGGKESRDHLRELCLDKDGILYVPFGGAKTLGDVFSFDRVIGRVYVDGDDLSQLQVTAGYATKERAK